MEKQYMEEEIREKYRRITQILIQKGFQVTTMESATSGQIASLITDTEGSSAVLKGAFITYSNEAKVMQGVPKKIIDKYSVYSVETAKAMAVACREKYQADFGIGVTGTMGNIDPENEHDSTPGEVYFAIADKEKVEGFFCQLPVLGSRLMYKLAVADEVADRFLLRIGN